MRPRFVYMIAGLLGVVLFSSCGVSSFSDEEITAAAETLIEESIAINEIYFGKGLPCVDPDSEAARSFAGEIQTDATLLSYLPVREDAGYDSIDSMKEATEKVYSGAYCTYLFEMGFTGISVDEGAATHARYMETENGTLAVHKDLSVIDARTYSAEDGDMQVEVIRKKGNTAVVKVQSDVDGAEDVTVEIQMIYEEDGWRLDSPTY